ncbi:MAG: hypothetical protein KAR06_01910, partial [Deltaproteobacteria bacterium]|nr:hypothetical protein [Deltaproteobacteria bacterium]
KNTSGSDLTNCTSVRISGASGSNPEFDVTDADNPAKWKSIGLLTENVSNNSFGYNTSFGRVRECDTSGTPVGEVWAANDEIYASNTGGELTNVIPTDNSRKIFIGTVLRAHATEGTILVSPDNVPFPSELSGPTIPYSEYSAENITVTINGGAFTNVGGLTNGVSNNVTLTNSTGAVDILYDGVYEAIGSVSGSDPDSNSETYHFTYTVDGTPQTKCEIHRSISVQAAVGAVPFTCKLSLTAGQVVHAAISSDGGDDFDVEHLNWGLKEIR